MKEFDSIVTEAFAKEKKYIPYEFLRDGESVDNPFLGISENDYRTIITRMMYFVLNCMGYTSQ
ncbi:MAG: hypothetical protein ACFFF9_15885 [Candidatus Thorarchaeota archaeon]